MYVNIKDTKIACWQGRLFGRVAQLARASSCYPKVVDLIPGQGTYKNQLVNAYISGTTYGSLSLSLSLSFSFSPPPSPSLSLKSIH